MPYIMIDKADIEVSKENNDYHFNICFTNKGNGTAINVRGKYLSDESKEYLCPMCLTNVAVYGCACPFDYESDVLKFNDTSHMTMYQKLNNNSILNNIDEVYFKILFQDMYFNQYEQQFMFLFYENKQDDIIEIGRVSVDSPQLCKDDNYEK